MSFPTHIARVLEAYGIRADTKASLYDLYIAMGNEVLEVFADVSEHATRASDLLPEDTLGIRNRVVERYLRRNHPRWMAGLPTPSLWHPREAEGRASGVVVPIRGDTEPALPGILLLGRNAHFGGRAETISFDFVAHDVEDAIAIGTAEGQQHTLPGSVGETSGTFDSSCNVALIWEIQPNVYKPQGERNRAIAKLYRKHRDWHLATLSAALQWLAAQKTRVFVLRGEALAIAHEVNPGKPVSATIAGHHDRTVERVLSDLGATLADPSREDDTLLLESCVMNHALRKHVLVNGAAGTIQSVMIAVP